jgi:hypothetical protein
MDQRDLRAARLARERDIERLAEMEPEEVEYLGRVHELPDPLTDGIGCESV